MLEPANTRDTVRPSGSEDRDHGVSSLRFVTVDQRSALAKPLLSELTVDYVARYGGSVEDMASWLQGRASEFGPPGGSMMVGLLPSADGEVPVTGGAFCPYDAKTAELKRIWTHSGYRRRGLARRLLSQLEAQIADRGYSRMYLVAGDRQPEAEALYLASGFRRLDEPLPTEDVYPDAFTGVEPRAFAKDVPGRAHP